MKTTKLVLTTLALFIALTFGLTSNAKAQAIVASPDQNQGYYLGFMLGGGIPNNNLSTQVVAGIHGGIHPSRMTELGLYGTFQSLGSVTTAHTFSAASASAALSIIAVEGNVLFPTNESNNAYFYLGGKVGMGILSSSVSEFQGYNSAYAYNTGVHFAVGPAGGFLFKLFPDAKIGAEANYIILPSTDHTLSSINVLANIVWGI
jgi:hypothetical protein